MCGIAGVFHYRSGAPVEPERLKAMTRVLAHRGPDGDGCWIDGPVGLGHRRLAILDLSGGAQPMGNEDGQLQIVFNGEIYNFEELVPGLRARGHRFRTRSDTEVILHQFEEEGIAALDRFRGMFAFALWDGRARRLHLVRDRLGVKPLYYADIGGTLYFGSEVKALLARPELPRDIDAQVLPAYLSLGFAPRDASILSAVRQVPPGHHLAVEPGGAPVIERWFEFRRTAPPRPGDEPDEEALLSELEAHLSQTVALRMVSDVPVGAFLSGGIDSGLVVALMARQSHRPVKTFSIGFDFEEFDERPYARMVAERYATDHEEFVVQADVPELLPHLTWHFDDPFADPSAIPMWRVAEIAAREVTVALSGDGGDEGFGGYQRYVNALADSYADRLPAPVRGMLGRVAAALPDSARGKNRLRWLSRTGDARYAEFFLGTPPHLVRRHLGSEWRAAAAETPLVERLMDVWRDCPFSDPLARMQYYDARLYLPGDILPKVDRASMGHSLEAREPLLDHRVMEFGFNLPPAMRADRNQGKILLKKLARRLLPVGAVDRPKHGFSVPLDRWFRGELRPLLFEVLLDDRTRRRGWLDVGGVERTIREHADGKARHGTTLWGLLVLELWARRFLDGPLDPPPPPPPRTEFLARIKAAHDGGTR